MTDDEKQLTQPYCCAHCVASDRIYALVPLVEQAPGMDGSDRRAVADALLVLAGDVVGRKTGVGQQLVNILLAPIPERAAREVARRTAARA